MEPSYEAMTTVRPVLYPAAQHFLDDLAAQGGTPIFKLPVAEARSVLNNLQSGPTPKLPADVEDRNIPGGPTGQVSVRVIRPSGIRKGLPAVMYFHGGGWVLGSKATHDRLIREIACGAGVAVVFVNFTPSPEAKYPQPIEEAFAVTRWVAEKGKEIGIDPTRLCVAGDSVGGNMAAAVTLMAKQRGGPGIAFQLLFYPVTDANFDTGSYKQFAAGYFLTREAMKWFWENYLPDVAARKQALACPLQASPEQLRGLPPALIITGECDVLRDEGEAYARKLIQAGVTVTAARYLAIIHDFVMLDVVTQTPAARGAIAQANSALRRALGL